MEVFVRSVELSGFSSAARSFGMTPSAVSKLISRLEARLGARLVNRSTRDLRLTAEGLVYFERASRIFAEIDEAERGASAGNRPVGRIRINTSASYGTHVLAPIVAEFLDRFPGVELDIVQTDRIVDLLADGTDVAIRAGPLKSFESLVARKLGDTALLMPGSPPMSRGRGTPLNPDDLGHNAVLGFDYARAGHGWPFRIDGQTVTLPVGGRVKASDGEALRYSRSMAADWLGWRNLQSAGTVQRGVWCRFSTRSTPASAGPSTRVYVGQGGQLPARVPRAAGFPRRTRPGRLIRLREVWRRRRAGK